MAHSPISEDQFFGDGLLIEGANRRRHSTGSFHAPNSAADDDRLGNSRRSSATLSRRSSSTDCESIPEDSNSWDSCTGDYLTGRFDVFSTTVLNSNGTGSPSIVRLKNGVIQWATLPRNKRSSTSFTDTQADALLESPNCLPLDLVISAKLRQKTSKQAKQDVVGFTVHGAQPQKVGRNGNPLLGTLCLQFSKGRVKACNDWVTTINRSLTATGRRPQNLLFFINPMAGKGDAALIFQQTVRPYLKAADVHADVMLLNGPGSMRKYLADPKRDVQQYDGIVAVGGDGTLNELINISIFRALESHISSYLAEGESKEEGEESPEHIFSIDQLRCCQHRIAVVPAGTINHIAVSVLGSDSPAVATLHILLGGKYLMDVCSLSSQHRLLTFGTTAVFSCNHTTGCRSPKQAKRKLSLRLTTTSPPANLKPEKEPTDFYTSLRYQLGEVAEPSNKHKPLETAPTVESDLTSSLSLAPQMEIIPLVDDRLATVARWSSITGNYGYLCVFTTPYLDPENPSASSPRGLLDVVLADSLSRKDMFKHVKKKFQPEQNGSLLCHAQQAYINISPPLSVEAKAENALTRRRSTSVLANPYDAVAQRTGSLEEPTNEGNDNTSEVGSIGTIYSALEVDPNVTIGHLKRISWSSIRGLAGEPQYQPQQQSSPSAYTWYVDGDPIGATSVHVCILPKIINFLAMPLSFNR